MCRVEYLYAVIVEGEGQDLWATDLSGRFLYPSPPGAQDGHAHGSRC